MKALKQSLLLVLAATMAIPLAAQRRLPGPEIGEAAPALRVTELLQAPAGASASWESLAGIPVVLEFWATWCSPCVENISHLNALREEFAGQIEFIAISSEKRVTVEKFLANRPIDAWIGLDGDHSMFDAFGATSIPHTVLVDADGVVRAITHPSQVTTSSLERLISGEELALPDKSQSGLARLASVEISADGPTALEMAIIRASTQDFTASSTNPRQGSKKFVGFRAEDVIRRVFGLTSPRSEILADLPEQKFDAEFKLPGRPDLMDELARLSVLAAFGLETRVEERELDVLEIHGLPDLPNKVKTHEPGTVSGSFFSGDDEAKGVSNLGGVAHFDALTRALEEMSGRPVFNVDLRMVYALPSVEWPIGDLEKMTEVLREKLGIAISVAKRKVEVRIFTPYEN